MLFFFKQKTAYEMRISDWSSDVCSSDLLVINRPTDLKLSEMMEQMELEHQGLADEAIVFWGGPVQPERGFVVHRQPGGWESSMAVANGLYITTSRHILRAHVGRASCRASVCPSV